MNTKDKGILTEVLCMVEFSKLGLKFSIPYGDSCKYDFILDVNGYLLRIQCKTSRKLDNEEGFIFKCESTVVTRTRTICSRYTLNEIDYFATIDNGQCYLVPVEECGATKTLRYCYPKNGQKKGISLAENYKLEDIIQPYLNGEI